MLNQDLIRERAYMLWLESGGAIGGGDEHWLRAEREITVAAPAAAKPARAKRPAAKAKAPSATAAKPRASRRSSASAA